MPTQSYKGKMLGPYMQYQTPTQLFYLSVVELLKQAIQLDIDDDKKGYCRAIKNLWRLLIGSIPDEHIKTIDAAYKCHKAKLKEIDEQDLPESQKEVRKLKEDYYFYDGLTNYLVAAVRTSDIMPKEESGRVIHGSSEEGIKKLAEAIQQIDSRKIKLMEADDLDDIGTQEGEVFGGDSDAGV